MVRRISEIELHTMLSDMRAELDACEGETEYAQKSIDALNKLLLGFALTLVMREYREGAKSPEDP